MPRGPRAYNISRKQTKELLAQPGCTRDEELSTLIRFGNAYLLPDGRVLLYIPDDVMGIIYESRQDLMTLMEGAKQKPVRSNPEIQVQSIKSSETEISESGYTPRPGQVIYRHLLQEPNLELQSHSGTSFERIDYIALS